MDRRHARRRAVGEGDGHAEAVRPVVAGLGADDGLAQRDDRGLERLFLHALTLRLPAGDGDDAEVFVRAPLPDDLRGVLERLPESPLAAPAVREALELT